MSAFWFSECTDRIVYSAQSDKICVFVGSKLWISYTFRDKNRWIRLDLFWHSRSTVLRRRKKLRRRVPQPWEQHRHGETFKDQFSAILKKWIVHNSTRSVCLCNPKCEMRTFHDQWAVKVVFPGSKANFSRFRLSEVREITDATLQRILVKISLARSSGSSY